MKVRDLEPKILWNNFENLNAVPRPSKKEEKIIKYVKEFGEKLNLETYVDKIGNVIIKKPATLGMENKKTVILQSHIDMVHQKNADTDFDFNSQGIISYIDNDWVKAKGTTLGADNGIGASAMLSILESKDIEHPNIEALFTIDEETGMTGAFNLEKGILEGKILLNLDTEDDDEFSIGCAGGIDTNTIYKYNPKDVSKTSKAFKITVKGLKGGHSGMDIHLERGNANKIMNRLIYNSKKYGLEVGEIDGGSLRNAIPRESFAIITLENEDFLINFKEVANNIKNELSISEPNLSILIEESDFPKNTMSVDDVEKMTNSIQSLHNGVYKMSLSIPGLVETSSSLARVIVKNGEFKTQSLQRSSVESSKIDVAYTVGAALKNMGANVEHTGSYPGWNPNPNSEILDIMVNKYTDMFKEKPNVAACHAGLECGILGERYPGVDMISFGPTIKNPHSPDEKVNINSVNKFWNFLLETLKIIPNN